MIVGALRRLGCHTAVAVMKAADNWNGNKSARLSDRIRLIGGKGRLAFQPMMRPGNVIILLDVFLEQSFQVFFIENDHMVQELAP